MNRLKIIFAGSGAFGSPTLDALLDAGHQLVQVITQPDKPAGRGKKLTPTPIAQHAEQLGLTATRTDDLNALPLEPADVMVVIAFGQKIGPPAVAHARLGAVNLHASRLPKYRGAAPIHWAIANGDATTGNSIIRLADKMDAGAVLGMTEVPIGPTETTGELHDRLARDGATLMLHVLQQLADGTAAETEQDPSQATIAKKLSRELAVLDFTRHAQQVARRINGFSPWPGCRVQITSPDGTPSTKLTLLRARAISRPSTSPSGTIDADGFIVVADGVVELLDVQPDNKRPMPFADFRRGNRWLASSTVTSAV